MAPRSRSKLRLPAGKAGLLAALAIGLCGCDRGLLDPVGPVGQAEKMILINSTAIMLAIVIPTIIATRIRDSQGTPRSARYVGSPEGSSGPTLTPASGRARPNDGRGSDGARSADRR